MPIINRQNAVAEVAREADVVLVVGSADPWNSGRLVELSRRRGTPAHLIDDARAMEPQWLDGAQVMHRLERGCLGPAAPRRSGDRLPARARAGVGARGDGHDGEYPLRAPVWAQGVSNAGTVVGCVVKRIGRAVSPRMITLGWRSNCSDAVSNSSPGSRCSRVSNAIRASSRARGAPRQMQAVPNTRCPRGARHTSRWSASRNSNSSLSAEARAAYTTLPRGMTVSPIRTSSAANRIVARSSGPS